MAERKSDEYKSVKFYAENTKAKTAGFSKFQKEKDYYFCRYIDGNIAMLSQAYTSAAGRDNGIESVKKNEKLAKRYVFEKRGAKNHGFALKAGNGQEIAISPSYGSATQAQQIAERLTGKAKAPKATPKKPVAKKAPVKPKIKASAKTATAKAAFTSSDQRIENYKPLAFYQKHGGNREGFNSFEHEGASYFHYNKNGEIVLISESYTSKAGRDGGIASVKKNMPRKTAYQYHTHKNGKHYFDINAANHQEIATSRWYSTKAKAQQGAASLRGETTKPRAGNVEQNYMPIGFYKKATTGKKEGFETFKGNDGEHYFVYFENDKLALISEGYPTAAIRDKGMASVEKNMKTESRYVFGKRADGKEGFALRAGNNKEIARSVGYGSAANAAAVAGYLMGTRKRAAIKKAKPVVVPVKAKTVAKPATSKPKPVKSKPKTKPPVVPMAAGAATAAGLAAGAAASKPATVKKSAVSDEPIEPKPAPVKTAPIAAAALGTTAVAGAAAMGAASKSEPVAPVAAAPAASTTAAPVTGAPIAAAAASVETAAAASGGGGIWGWLKWVLMGLLALLAMLFLFKTCASGDKSAKTIPTAATTEMATPAAMVTCWDGSKAKDNQTCPAKVTCWDDSFAEALSQCPVQPIVKDFECWDGSTAADLAECPVESKVGTLTAAGTTITGVSPEISVANSTSGRNGSKMLPPSVADRICGPSSNPLFDVSGMTLKNVGRLGTNPQFGNSLTYTPDEFFRRLQVKYRTSPRDKSFLDLLAKSLGHGSFVNMDASMFSNDTLPKGTSGLLGFGTEHALQFSTLNVNDPSHLEAFKVRSANGADVHFMKRCGNYMYVCQP